MPARRRIGDTQRTRTALGAAPSPRSLRPHEADHLVPGPGGERPALTGPAAQPPGPRLKAQGPLPKLLFTVEEAAAVLGVGRTTVFGLLRDGRLGSVRIGASRRISMASLEAYVAQLMATDACPGRIRGVPKVTTAGHNGGRPRSRRSNASSPCGEVLALPFAGEVPPATS